MRELLNSSLAGVFRRMRKVLIFSSVLLCVSAAFSFILSWIWDDQRLPLTRLVVRGDLEHVRESDVQLALSNLDHIGTFMSQEVGALKRAVEDIPWVDQVAIRKQWPNIVEVFLTEHKALAIWNDDSILDKYGTIFNGDMHVIGEEIVRLYGPEGSIPEVLATWKKYNPGFSAFHLRIASLALSRRKAWKIMLDDGTYLELGSDHINERIARFFSLYHSLGEKAKKISCIDLRYNSGAAVSWSQQ